MHSIINHTVLTAGPCCLYLAAEEPQSWMVKPSEDTIYVKRFDSVGEPQGKHNPFDPA